LDNTENFESAPVRCLNKKHKEKYQIYSNNLIEKKASGILLRSWICNKYESDNT